MDIDRRERRNCYNCGGFIHIARNCRNRETENRIREGKRLEYEENMNNRQSRIEGGNGQSNLNGKGDLIVFD